MTDQPHAEPQATGVNETRPPHPVNGPPAPADLVTALRGLSREPLYWLLIALPAAVVLEVAHAGGLWIFIVSGLAIIPLAGLMGRATENLAETFGSGIGGLLNATFGNAAELIILETVTVILSVGVLSMVSQDGEAHWMEGVMLLAVYGILALAFYHLPEVAG
jgi:Ca2+/H+ antiporter